MLLGYRNIFTAEELLTAVQKQRKKYKRKDLLDDSVEERFYAFIIQWILLFENDFKSIRLRKRLMKFATLSVKSYRNALPYLQKLLDDEKGMMYLGINNSNGLMRTKRRPSFKGSKTRKKITFYNILDYDAEDIAKQLTLLEAIMISDVSAMDFIGKDWLENSKLDSSPLAALSRHFNRVSLWVASAIVACSSQRKIIRMYKKFARVAKVCCFYCVSSC